MSQEETFHYSFDRIVLWQEFCFNDIECLRSSIFTAQEYQEIFTLTEASRLS